MQKKLIAAAVAGLIAVPALAQTNVTISGRFAAGYQNYKLSGPATGYDSYNGVSDQSSRIIFNVNEDLGGGLSAWGQMDMRFSVDSAGPAPAALTAAQNVAGNIASGNTGLGLASKTWGKFTIGRWDVHYSEIAGGTNAGNRAGALENITSFGLMSQVNGATIANGTRTPNLLMWDSPSWNGFTARLGYSTGAFSAEGGTNRGVGDPGDGSAWTGAVRYANGPWKAGLSYWNADANEGGAATGIVPVLLGTGDQRSTRFWGSYQFAMGLSVGFAYDRSSVDLGAMTSSRSAWYIPINYAFGPHKVYFDYSRANDASNTVGNSSGKQWSLGYDYAFSKRTSAGVYYSKVSNNTAGSYDMFAAGRHNGSLATVAGEDARMWYFGLAHNF